MGERMLKEHTVDGVGIEKENLDPKLNKYLVVFKARKNIRQCGSGCCAVVSRRFLRYR
jgi:hypothetical protein